MMKAQIRDIITKIHFYLLGFALLNFTLKNTIEISLNYRLTYFITLLIYASGIILFFWNFKPFKKTVIYYSFYFITPLLTLIFWLFGGIFFALLSSIFLYPIYPNELTEKKYWFLEKKIMEINLYEAIDFEKASLKSKDGKSELKIKYKDYEFGPEKSVETDTIIKIETK